MKEASNRGLPRETGRLETTNEDQGHRGITIKTGARKSQHKTAMGRVNKGHRKIGGYKVRKGLRKTGTGKISSGLHRIVKARDSSGQTRQQATGRDSKTGSPKGRLKIVLINLTGQNMDLIIAKKKNNEFIK